MQHGNTAPRFVNPNQLSVAPTNAAYGLAGLGLLGVETVNIRGAVGDGGFKEGMKGPLCAHQLEGCTVWPIFHHTHTYTHTHTLDPFGGRIGGVGGGEGCTGPAARAVPSPTTSRVSVRSALP